ncbi:MAG: DUF1553 domain-containing protein [Planctomycetes bacterium]|nr:DUF1553 domain-containing protein [Planctomycetota bacterium]NBY01430.1 DUF1553 domain-containing protein [Planctomycetota bacterium]
MHLIAFLITLNFNLTPDFDREIKPFVVRSCVSCHNAESKRGGFRMDSARAILKGGNSGPAVLPGKSSESLILHALTGKENVEQMPPKGPKLSKDEISLLRSWIDSGAKLPASEALAVEDVKKTTHWSFLPITKPALPVVADKDWCRNPIDYFVMNRLAKDKMTPSVQADRSTLIRRVSLDLTGIPPTPIEVENFLNDKSPNAYEKVVARLLDSPQYGERWARLWLDQARYADSNGYSIDGPRSIWKYRDWVISALNSDMPFDRFSTLQLAGDLVAGSTLDDKVATGFHRNTSINQEGGIDKEQFRVESVVDRVNTTGTVWLGLTVGCCQCHDHKFDPLTQKEYYQFFAFFNTVDEPNLELAPQDEIKKRDKLKLYLKKLETSQKQLDPLTPAKIAALELKIQSKERELLPPLINEIIGIAPNGRTPSQERSIEAYFRQVDRMRHIVGMVIAPNAFVALTQGLINEKRASLDAEIFKTKEEIPEIDSTLVVQEMAKPRSTNIHLGGEFTRKGAPVESGVPQVLHSLRSPKPNRMDLSNWLFDKDNPLTSRVTVNRFWQVFFGVGIVETENDFGTQGTLPTHPELLDWLATEFRNQGWSVKSMHRLMVTSATYMQASKSRPEYEKIDARNRLLYRQNRIRLDAEIVRDVGLASSGLLYSKIGGASVFPPQAEGVYSFTQVPKNWKPNSGANRYRRGMYTHFWRSAPHPNLVVFDAPDAVSSCTRRNRSNTPLQALTLLNDEAHVEFARELSNRLASYSSSDVERINQAFLICLARMPKPSEVEIITRLLHQNGSANPSPSDWFLVARALLNLDEFITRE